MTSLLIPPPQGHTTSSNGSSIASSVCSTEILSPSPGVPTDPIEQVIEVLTLLSSDRIDPAVAKKAGDWLSEFQRDRQTHQLVLRLLTAALIPEEAANAAPLPGSSNPLVAFPGSGNLGSFPGSVAGSATPSPRGSLGSQLGLPLGKEVSQAATPNALHEVGRHQPAVQHQLLLFVAQTLVAKLRKSVARAASDRTLEADDLLTPPSKIWLMAQRALQLSSGSHPALSLCLGVATGFMCILEVQKRGLSHMEPTLSPEAASVFNHCHSVILQDAFRYRTVGERIANDFASTESGMNLSQVLGILTESTRHCLAQDPLLLLAREEIHSYAVAAKVAARDRRLGVQTAEPLVLTLLATANEMIKVQRGSGLFLLQSVPSILQLLRARVLQSSERLANGADPELEQCCTATIIILKAGLDFFASSGELARDLIESATALFDRQSPDSQEMARNLYDAFGPLVRVAVEFLITLATLTRECGLVTVLGPVKRDTIRDFLDSFRQSCVAAADTVGAFMGRSRSLFDGIERFAGQAARMRGSGHQSLTTDTHGNDINLESLMHTSILATDVALHIAQVSAQAFLDFNLAGNHRTTVLRLQRLRSIRMLLDPAIEQATGPEGNISERGELLANSFESRAIARREAVMKAVGNFWETGEAWTPLPREEESSTPLELLSDTRFGTGRHTLADEDLVDEDGDVVDDLPKWSARGWMMRILMLEEAVGGFVASQIGNLTGAVLKSIAPLVASSMLMAEGETNQTARADGSFDVPSISKTCSDNVLRVSTAWLLVAIVDLSMPPSHVSEKAGGDVSSGNAVACNAVLILLNLVSQIAMTRHPLLAPQQGDIEEVLRQILEGKAVLDDWRAPAILPTSTSELDEFFGQACALAGLNKVFDWLIKFRMISKIIQRDLQTSGSYGEVFQCWVLFSLYTSIFEFPLNFEGMAFGAQRHVVRTKDDARRLARHCTIEGGAMPLMLQNLREMVSLSENDDWRRKCLIAARWTFIESFLSAIAFMGSVDPQKVGELLLDRDLLREAFGHRAIVKPLLGLVSSYLSAEQPTMNEALFEQLLRICRASLRLPQADGHFPLSSQEDHLGVVTVARLAAFLEKNMADPTALSIVAKFVAEKDDFIKDVIWLLEETCQRSFGRSTNAQTKCFASMASLPVLCFATGQLLSIGMFSRGGDNPDIAAVCYTRAKGLLDGLVRCTTSSIGLFGRDKSTELAMIAAMLSCQTTFLEACFPLGMRPGSEVPVRLGLVSAKPLKGFWDHRINQIKDTLKRPGDERDYPRFDVIPGLNCEAATDIANQMASRIGEVVASLWPAMDCEQREYDTRLVQLALLSLISALLSTANLSLASASSVLETLSESPSMNAPVKDYLASLMVHMTYQGAASQERLRAGLELVDRQLSSIIVKTLNSVIAFPLERSDIFSNEAEGVLGVYLARMSVHIFMELPKPSEESIRLGIILAIFSLLSHIHAIFKPSVQHASSHPRKQKKLSLHPANLVSIIELIVTTPNLTPLMNYPCNRPLLEAVPDENVTTVCRIATENLLGEIQYNGASKGCAKSKAHLPNLLSSKLPMGRAHPLVDQMAGESVAVGLPSSANKEVVLADGAVEHRDASIDVWMWMGMLLLVSAETNLPRISTKELEQTLDCTARLCLRLLDSGTLDATTLAGVSLLTRGLPWIQRDAASAFERIPSPPWKWCSSPDNAHLFIKELMEAVVKAKVSSPAAVSPSEILSPMVPEPGNRKRRSSQPTSKGEDDNAQSRILAAVKKTIKKNIALVNVMKKRDSNKS